MKRILLSVAVIVAMSLSTFAQSPESFKYQSVVRDASLNVIANQAVGMQITILQGSITGTVVYQETFAPTTNAYGLVNLEIGTGTVVSGTFSAIDWSAGPYFVETGLDVTGGTNYVAMGTSQLLSVPYALYAKTADSVVNDLVDDADADPTNELNTTVVLNGTNLETTDAGGTITTDLSTLVDDADADPTNELNTTVVLNGTNLETTDAGGTITTDLSTLVDDADADPTNELNTTVVLNGTNLETTDAGGTITTDLSTLVDDADADPTNEYNTTVVLNGTNLETTDGGGTITTDLTSLMTNADTLWAKNGTDISNLNTGNVGVGTTTPNEKLHVNGSGTTNYVQITNSTTGSTAADGFTIGNNGNAVRLAQKENSHIYFSTNGSDKMIIGAAGNVGIGTNAPSAKLDVEGNVQVVDGTQGTGKVFTSDAAGNASWQPVDPTAFNGANPAVSVWGNTNVTSTGTANSVTINSASITVPGPGRIIATSSVDVYCNVGCTAANNYVASFVTLTTNPTANASSGQYSYMFTKWLNTNSCTRTAVFNVTAAGTTTVYLRGRRAGGNGGTEVGFYRGQVTLMFIPN